VSGKRQIQHGKMPKTAKCRFKKRQIIRRFLNFDFELFCAYLGLLQAFFGKEDVSIIIIIKKKVKNFLKNGILFVYFYQVRHSRHLV
jgi:hypothetical protein